MEQIGKPQLLQIFFDIRVVDFQVGIGIVAAQGRHCQNLPGVYIHHHAEGTVLHIIAVDCCLYLFFQTGLYRSVQGQNHAAAGAGGDKVFVGIGHIHFVVALGGNYFTVASFQEAVICRFHTFGASIGSVGKTDNLAGKTTIRVVSLRIRLNMDAGDVLLIDKAADLSRGFLIHPVGDQLVA